MKLLFFAILLWPLTITDSKSFFIVWNVGQGLWSTFVDENKCLHFDIGGEIYPEEVHRYCLRKNNYIYISHWHKDHYSFLNKFSKNVLSSCLARHPPLFDPRLQKRFAAIKKCEKSLTTHEIKNPYTEHKNITDINNTSLVFTYSDVLLPGDITKKVEKKISPKLLRYPIKVLILPHHGSNTSTSQILLKGLPYARVAIASARKDKYGHPHHKIKQRLRQNSISLLSTEDWGPIFIQIK